MKTFLLVLVLVTISITGAYAGWIGMEYEIELGWSPASAFGNYEIIEIPVETDTGYWMYSSLDIDWWNAFYIELSTRVWLWNHVFVGGSVTTMINFADYVSFNPYFANYMFETGVRFGILEFFFSHDCSHPVSAESYAYRITSLWGEGAVNRIGLRLKGELK